MIKMSEHMQKPLSEYMDTYVSCKSRRRVSSVVLVEHSSANPEVRFRARSQTRVMDYDEACFIHLTPRVFHNFPKAVGV